MGRVNKIFILDIFCAELNSLYPHQFQIRINFFITPYFFYIFSNIFHISEININLGLVISFCGTQMVSSCMLIAHGMTILSSANSGADRGYKAADSPRASVCPSTLGERMSGFDSAKSRLLVWGELEKFHLALRPEMLGAAESGFGGRVSHDHN